MKNKLQVGTPAEEKMNLRNYGIDLLRIISMVMVCNLHILRNGGVLYNVVPFSINYNVAWFLEVICYCAVDCYGLISGYCLINNSNSQALLDFKYSRIFKLWAQVFFYCLLFTFIFLLIPSLNIFLTEDLKRVDFSYLKTYSNMIRHIFPILGNCYWYFSAYFGLFFLIPFLRIFLNHLSYKEYTQLVFVIFFFVLLEMLPGSDLLNFENGYSFVWLVLLFILGGYFKLYGENIQIKNKILMICFLCSTGLVLLSILITHKVWFVNYVSPFIILNAICLLVIFSRLKISEKLGRIITCLGGLSFGVYLIHVNPLIWNIYTDKFKFLATGNPIVLVFSALCISVAMYIVCSGVDALRSLIFKILRIDLLTKKLCRIEDRIKIRFYNYE